MGDTPPLAGFGGAPALRGGGCTPIPSAPPQLCGVALIALGIYAHVALDKTLVVSSASASSTPLAILVLGIVIFFISFFGCCGAWKESYCMVTTVSALTAPPPPPAPEPPTP